MRPHKNADGRQQLLRIRRLRGRHQREKERIDLAMAEVPGLPRDWEDWVYHSAFYHDHYMMYHYGDRTNSAWCTYCGKDVNLKRKVRYGEELRCPNCGKKVTALSWNRSRQISDSKKPGILQERKNGGYVLRVFESRIVRYLADDWRLDEKRSFISEKYRIFLDREFRQETVYEYTFWKNQPVNGLRWCYATNHGGYGYGDCSNPDECVLYHRNLRKLRKGTCLKYIPLELLYGKNPGWYGRVVYQLFELKRTPQIEYMIKAGLYHLAWDIISHNYADGNIDLKKKKPWDVLGIDRQQLSMAIKMNISLRQLSTLQEGNRLGIRLTRKQVEFYSSELGNVTAREVLRNGHAEKAMKYLQAMKARKERTGDYIDYLDDIRALGIDPTEDVIFPRNFAAAHERLSEQRREHDNIIKAAKIAEKDRMLQLMLPELRKIYTKTKADRFLMVLPECKEDFNREGRENHNCVGGRYFDKMLEGRCTVLFLRRKEEPDKAFCTVEMNGATVVQCRAVRNSTPPEEVQAFMKSYSAEVEKRLMKIYAAKSQRHVGQKAADGLMPAI